MSPGPNVTTGMQATGLGKETRKTMPSTSTWATEAGVNDLMVIIHVQNIWRGLSYGGREALLSPNLPAHGNAIRGLERKGLWADGAPTELGLVVAKFRPDSGAVR